MLTRILFLADVSLFSERALAWAAEKMAGQKADFLILHVVDPAAGMESPHLVREAEGYLEELCSRILPPDFYYKALVLSGDLMEMLPKALRDEECTFALIPAAAGEDVLPLIRAIPVPQIILREQEGFFPEAGIFSRLAVALDLEPGRTSLILDNLRAFLSQTGQKPRITLVHAVSPLWSEEAPGMLNTAGEALEEVRGEIASWGFETSSEIVLGNPENELPGKIGELAPTMLAMGLPAAGELGQLLAGATAEALLSGTTCPLLVFPL